MQDAQAPERFFRWRVCDDDPNAASIFAFSERPFPKDEKVVVAIPNVIGGKKVVAIDDCAFFDCRLPTRIEIPESVERIGTIAFLSCSSLMEFNVAPNNTRYKDENGVLFSKDGEVLTTHPPGRESCVVPKGVKRVGANAFADGCLLKSILLPDGLTHIEEGAFSGCVAIDSIDLPTGLKTVGEDAFFHCSSLTAISLPEGLTKLGDRAFLRCSSLSSVSLPQSLEKIGENSFDEISDDCVFYVQARSYACRWAIENGYDVEIRRRD